MPSLFARLQEIIGEKIFRDKVTFDKDVVFKKHITGYAPVPGEPSLGTWHDHYARLISNAAPVAGGYYDVDASGHAPVGAKKVYIKIQGIVGAGNVLQAFTDSTPTPADAPITVGPVSVAATTVYGAGEVTLSATRHFVYNVPAAASGVYIIMFSYLS
jgi:hypothetical protein